MSLKTFYEFLTEAPLSRVWAYFGTPDYPSGIISASRRENTAEVNATQTRALAQEVRKAGFGYQYADGHWIETDETTGKKNPVSETSVIIRSNPGDNGKLKGYLRKWRAMFHQEAVLYKPEGQTHVFVIDANSETDIGVFHPNRIADMMTRIRGRGARSFVIERAYSEMNWFGRLAHRTKMRAQEKKA